MFGAPICPTVRGMRTATTSDQPQASDLPARTPCAMCEHPEFVHGDSETRKCLYTECDCIRFAAAAVE